MKKICFVISSLAGGGAEKSVLKLAEELSNLRHEVHIIIINNIIEHKIFPEKYTIHCLQPHGRLASIKLLNENLLLKKLQEVLSAEEKKKKFDLIVSNLTDSDKLCSKLKHPNLYFCIRNNESAKLKKKSFLKKLRVQKRYSNKNIITISEGLSHDILNVLQIKPKSIQTIYNSFDFIKIKKLSEEKQPAYKNYLIHIGRYTSQKRHDILLKSYKDSNVEEKLLLLGTFSSSEKKEINHLITILGLQKKVIVIGFMANPYPLIKHAKLLILSSDYEGFGNVLVEALALNTMVISTNCPYGPSEILTGPLTPFLSPPGDIDLLSENIKKALSFPLQEKNVSLEKFNIHEVVKQYLSLCN